MIQDWFCDTYSSIEDRHPLLKQIRFYSLLRWLTRRTANIVLPIAFRCRPCKKRSEAKSSTKVIVSFTTFPARINKIWLVIESILRQTVLPDHLILWLSKEQFAAINVLPKSLLRMQACGVEIRLVDGDIRSHKKYVYALQQYPNDILITIDDDIFYRSTMIAELLTSHQRYPQSVIAQYTHNIQYDSTRCILPYGQWENNAMQGDHLFFGSGGGTLFPPHVLHEDVTAYNTALRLCPCADDIWLNMMTRLNNTPIIHTNRHTQVLPVLNKYAQPLSAQNIVDGNDVQLQQVIAYCIQHYHTNPFEQ